MNFHNLCRKVAKLEGGKKQVDIAQISEIISCLIELLRDDQECFKCFISYLIWAEEN